MSEYSARGRDDEGRFNGGTTGALALSYRIATIPVAAIILLVVAVGFPVPALAAPVGSVMGTAHAIKCVDIAGFDRGFGDNVIQWDCHGGANQRFKFYPHHPSGSPGIYSIQNVNSGLCLQAPGNEGGARPGKIHQYDCTDFARNWLWRVEYGGENEQGWHLYRFYLGEGDSKMCMDVDHASKENGAAIIAWYCNGGLNQWFLMDIQLDHD